MHVNVCAKRARKPTRTAHSSLSPIHVLIKKHSRTLYKIIIWRGSVVLHLHLFFSCVFWHAQNSHAFALSDNSRMYYTVCVKEIVCVKPRPYIYSFCVRVHLYFENRPKGRARRVWTRDATARTLVIRHHFICVVCARVRCSVHEK